MIGSFPHQTAVTASGRGDGDRLLLASATEKHVLLWNLDVTQWADVACRAAGRNLTATEWAQFGPKGETYRATCPHWPSAA